MSYPDVPQFVSASSSLLPKVAPLVVEEGDINFADYLFAEMQPAEQEPTVEEGVLEESTNEEVAETATEASFEPEVELPEILPIVEERADAAHSSHVSTPNQQMPASQIATVVKSGFAVVHDEAPALDAHLKSVLEAKADPPRPTVDAPKRAIQPRVDSQVASVFAAGHAIPAGKPRDEKAEFVQKQISDTKTLPIEITTMKSPSATSSGLQELQLQGMVKPPADADVLRIPSKEGKSATAATETIVRARGHWTVPVHTAEDKALTPVPSLLLTQVPVEGGEIESRVDSVVSVGAQRSSLDAQIGSPIPAAPASQPHIARAAAGQMAVAIMQSGSGTTEIMLSPEELGKVRMVVTAQDTTISLVIQAERPETHDLLRRQIETLAQEFRNLGFGSINFTFERGQGGATDESDDSHQQHTTNMETDSDDQTVSRVQTHSGNGLDLRL